MFDIIVVNWFCPSGKQLCFLCGILLVKLHFKENILSLNGVLLRIKWRTKQIQSDCMYC